MAEVVLGVAGIILPGRQDQALAPVEEVSVCMAGARVALKVCLCVLKPVVVE